tara:strand:+ start:48 stop:521 length:474 start_codon:yes stop_codon:yes gene_type:complete
MALTKVKGSGVEGITNLSNATFLSVDASEVATLLTTAVINSEGGAVTTNIAQGLAKAWHVYKSTDTFAVLDSLNGASATDHGTGDHTTTVTNAFASVNYTNHFSAEFNQSDSKVVSGASHQHSSAKSTTALRHAFQNTSAEGRDGFQNTVTKHGDLA